ncbi:cytochrome b/b6/petB-like protein [Streptomyces sp. TLI_235]|nr:cytochrome b/b6/petB-like protein [Streptomyces sp. TLI_235]
MAHLILVFHHKHTQWAGPGRTEENVIGMPLMPVYLAKAGGFFFLVFDVIAAVSAIATINPIWAYGPYRPDQVSTDAQPDWYMGFAEGLIRVMPGWEVRAWGHTLNLGILIPFLAFPAVLGAIAGYPFLKRGSPATGARATCWTGRATPRCGPPSARPGSASTWCCWPAGATT